MDALVRTCARDNVLGRMENDASNLGLAISSLQLLDQLATVAAENLDDMAADGGRGDKGAIIVNRNGANFRTLVRNYAEVDAFVDDCCVRD